MKQQDFISMYLCRIGLFAAAFLIAMFLHSQLLEYQQVYVGYMAQLQALQPAIIENTENIAQAEFIISELGKATNYYLLLIFGAVPLMMFLAYLIFEWLFWKKFLGASGKKFFLRFLAVSAAGMVLIVGIVALFWNLLNFENYSLDANVLWFPVILLAVHYFIILTYFGLHENGFKAAKQAFNTGLKKIYIGLPLSALAYLFFLAALYGFFVAYTHFQQQIVNGFTYAASFLAIISIAAGIYFTSLFYEKFYLRYFSIKK